MVLEDTRQTLENIINSDPLLKQYFSNGIFSSRQPSYRYFYHKGSKDQYFWTTESVKHNGRIRYASGIYRYFKIKHQFRLTRECFHARRNDAKARALKLWNENKKVNNAKENS